MNKRIGEINYNFNNERMEIITYRSATDIDILFEDGTIVKSRVDHFKEGAVKNYNFKQIYNVGYLGYGKYKCSFNRKATKCYNTWKCMLERCYDLTCKLKHPTYQDCIVCEEWHNYQNFAKWYDENFYQINNKTMELDKDILVKGNKVYSPENCIFVSNDINVLFTNRKLHRGTLPIGVYYVKSRNRYIARVNRNGKSCDLVGYCKTPEEAFLKYKKAKENEIKRIANNYRQFIPLKLYEAMINYEVDILD